MEGRLKSRYFGLLEVVWDTEPAYLSGEKAETVIFIHRSVSDFPETDEAGMRITNITAYPTISALQYFAPRRTSSGQCC